MAEKRTFDKNHPILDAMKQTFNDLWQHKNKEETIDDLLKNEKKVEEKLDTSRSRDDG